MNNLVPAEARSTAIAKSKGVAPDSAQYLTFMLGGEIYAVAILVVKEIIEFRDLTEVPMMPASVRGVINLRGAVVPVMDLGARLGKPVAQVTKRTCIVIIEIETEGEQQLVGVVVDAVNAVLDIPGSQIEPPPKFGARIRADFIEGMGKVDGKFVILLNISCVLSLEEISSLATLAGEAAEALSNNASES